MSEPRAPEGVLERLRSLGATLLDAASTRAELAVTEFHEQNERRKEILVLAVAAGVFGAMALLLFALLIVVIFWDTYRIAAAAGVTILYLGIAAWAYFQMRAKARAMPPPFEATLRELAADREMLRKHRES